jgi:hypothetical protein
MFLETVVSFRLCCPTGKKEAQATTHTHSHTHTHSIHHGYARAPGTDVIADARWCPRAPLATRSPPPHFTLLSLTPSRFPHPQHFLVCRVTLSHLSLSLPFPSLRSRTRSPLTPVRPTRPRIHARSCCVVDRDFPDDEGWNPSKLQEISLPHNPFHLIPICILWW